MHDNALLMQYHYQKWNIALFHYWFYNNALMQYCIIIFGKLHYLICIIFFTYFDKISWFQNIFINFKKHCFGSLIQIYLLYRYSDINKQSMMKLFGLGKWNELAYIYVYICFIRKIHLYIEKVLKNFFLNNALLMIMHYFFLHY